MSPAACHSLGDKYSFGVQDEMLSECFCSKQRETDDNVLHLSFQLRGKIGTVAHAALRAQTTAWRKNKAFGPF